MATTTDHPSLFEPHVEVRVSTRRKKTAAAHWEGDRIVVMVPSHLRGLERDQMVEELARRLERHRPHFHGSDVQLAERARQLGRRYLGGVEPSSIRWSAAQLKRWGSCTIGSREIRISERLRSAPGWVVDAVIVHELAHLIEPSHSSRFTELEARYPRRRDADLCLEGYALGLQLEGCGSPPAPSEPAAPCDTEAEDASV
jgi:predicted metal-dependent hydrolase